MILFYSLTTFSRFSYTHTHNTELSLSLSVFTFIHTFMNSLSLSFHSHIHTTKNCVSLSLSHTHSVHVSLTNWYSVPFRAISSLGFFFKFLQSWSHTSQLFFSLSELRLDEVEFFCIVEQITFVLL